MIYDIYAVGNTLRSIRNKYGYTQNDMAESLDVSYIHYSQIEQDESGTYAEDCNKVWSRS